MKQLKSSNEFIPVSSASLPLPHWKVRWCSSCNRTIPHLLPARIRGTSFLESHTRPKAQWCSCDQRLFWGCWSPSWSAPWDPDHWFRVSNKWLFLDFEFAHWTGDVFLCITKRGFQEFFISVWFGVGQLNFSEFCQFFNRSSRGGLHIFSLQKQSCGEILTFLDLFFFCSPKIGNFTKWVNCDQVRNLASVWLQKKTLEQE